MSARYNSNTDKNLPAREIIPTTDQHNKTLSNHRNQRNHRTKHQRKKTTKNP